MRIHSSNPKENSMFHLNLRVRVAIATAAAAMAPAAHAQLAVIDVPAIVQLVQQVQTMEQQLATARSQLVQAQQELQSMSGDRGMERLLADVNRNYLPADWTQLTSVLQNSGGGYGAVAADLQSAISTDAVLSVQQLSTLPAAGQQQVQAARQWAAMRQVLARDALATTSNRFASLQTRIGAITTAADQKAILDLQARISAEQSMLQNEQTKLQILFQVALAEESANRQRMREQVIAGHGNFATRFQPAP
jgi:type IV secretion system protein VirB5